MNSHVAVLAGAALDTSMGVALLTARGISCKGYPVSDDPMVQTEFQRAGMAEKHARLFEILSRAKKENCDRALVYCNSLSGAYDFAELADEMNMKIVTPFDVYRDYAQKFRRFGVISVNAYAGAAGIEYTIMNANPDTEVINATLVPVMMAVEHHVPPDEIVKKYGLDKLMEWFSTMKCEAVVLGCTHFPYFKESLSRHTSIPLLDPGEDMIRKLSDRN